MRRLITMFLLLLLPLQGFASQGGWLSAGNGNVLTHELEHLEGTSHHHHDDGTVHYDDSEASVQHASEHCACHHTAALPSIGIKASMSSPMTIASIEEWQFIPDPTPERPQRPPSSSLG